MYGVGRPRPLRAKQQVGLVVGLAAVVSLVVSGCEMSASADPPTSSGASSTTGANPSVTSNPGNSPAPTPTPTLVSTMTPPVVKGLVWKPQGSKYNGVPVTYVARTDGGSVSLLWMDSSILKYRFVPGYAVPEGSPSTSADNKPSTWVPLAAAGFNGGFQLSDGRGGYYYKGSTVRGLQDGLGAFMITSDGTLKVGKWGRDLKKTADTVVVRQNLPLLVDNSKDVSQNNSGGWGVADGGVLNAHRTALGQLPDGALVFAFGSNVTPYELAQAMVKVGAKNAMVLDMNKSWPTGFTYTHSGKKTNGARIHPDIWRDPSSYYERFQKDFVMAQLPSS
ncbi:MAG: phosphodiester glycosidase family protein [Actinomycetes bacterium]